MKDDPIMPVESLTHNVESDWEDLYKSRLKETAEEYGVRLNNTLLESYAAFSWPRREDLKAKGILTPLDAALRFSQMSAQEKLQVLDEYRILVLDNLVS